MNHFVLRISVSLSVCMYVCLTFLKIKMQDYFTWKNDILYNQSVSHNLFSGENILYEIFMGFSY